MPDHPAERARLGLVRLAASLVDLAWPPSCPVCGLEPAAGADLCAPCLASIPGRGAPRCRRCGREAPSGRPRCRRCETGASPLDGVIVGARYEGAVRDLVHRLKFRGEASLAGPLARQLAGAIRQASLSPDRIAPVPLHWRRRWSRGFDQATLLAVHVGRALGRPVERRRLRRVRATAAQSLAGGSGARASNVAGAFALGPGPVCRGVWLLVDDVLSTGSTAGECARLLRRAGAARVHVGVVAR